MSIFKTLNTENSSTPGNSSANGFQNIGMMQKFSTEHKIPHKYRPTFMAIVEYSFGYVDSDGYAKSTTRSMSMKDWAKDLGISIDMFRRHIYWLSDENNGVEVKGVKKPYITTTGHKGFVEGGGTAGNRYSPVFPGESKYYINLKPDTSKTDAVKENADTPKMSREERNKILNIDSDEEREAKGRRLQQSNEDLQSKMALRKVINNV